MSSSLALVNTRKDPDWTPIYVYLGAMGGFILGTPIVHAANGQFLAAVGSLGLRISLLALENQVGGSLDRVPCAARMGASTSRLESALALEFLAHSMLRSHNARSNSHDCHTHDCSAGEFCGTELLRKERFTGKQSLRFCREYQ